MEASGGSWVLLNVSEGFWGLLEAPGGFQGPSKQAGSWLQAGWREAGGRLEASWTRRNSGVCLTLLTTELFKRLHLSWLEPLASLILTGVDSLKAKHAV